MHNFSINQRLKKMIYFDSFDYLIIFLINLFKNLYGQEGKPSTEKSKISNLILLIFWLFWCYKKFPHTDRPTFGLIEATCRRLKKIITLPNNYTFLDAFFLLVSLTYNLYWILDKKNVLQQWFAQKY